MRYVEARLEEEDREEAYRIYVTRSLQLIPQSGYIPETYYDITHNKIDNRTGDDIVLDIMQRAGLKV